MRKIVPKPPTVGKQRIRSGFLFFPKTLELSDGTRQQRWFEKTSWVQEYRNGYDENFWLTIGWLDD